MATDNVYSLVSPLNIRDDFFTNFTALDGGTSPPFVVGDADVVETTGVSDDASQALPTQDDPSASESGVRTFADPEPASSSVKAKQSKWRSRGPVDLDGLPNPEDELTNDQIASLCSQPPRVRQHYPQYFSKQGTIRAAYYNILLERRPDGVMRFSEDVLRSCLSKWKEHLEETEPGESSHAGRVQGRKRKGTATPAKRDADEDVGSRKKTKKSSASRREESSVDTLTTKPSPLLRPTIPPLRLRPVISRHTPIALGHPIAHTPHLPMAIHAEPSEDPSRIPFNGPTAAALGHNREVQSDSVEGQPGNSSDVPSMDTRMPLIGSQPGPAAVVVNLGCSQPLDPDRLDMLAQRLTRELQQMDFAIIVTAHTSHDQGRLQRLRALWSALVNLRDLCVDMEIEQRNHMVSKDREGMGKLI